MRYQLYIYFYILFIIACNNTKKEAITTKENHSIVCNNSGCKGTYEGREFVDGKDIAHQFSNKMSAAVGDELKALYRKKQYKKVDFAKIKMTTTGMGTGNVTYTLSIPFVTVNTKCEAYTSFDHVGGWNHTPALARRKKELKNVNMKGHYLDISELKTTPEGLQEYWIQWKNKNTQADCE